MAVYDVLQTGFAVSGKGKRWHVYRKDATVGDFPESGPFRSRKAAVEWAQAKEKESRGDVATGELRYPITWGL